MHEPCNGCTHNKSGTCTVPGFCAQVRALYHADGMHDFLPEWTGVLVPERKSPHDLRFSS